MIQLLIRKNETWIDADISNTAIAVTYQANDLADLKTREANRTNRIKLPKTAKNNRIFEIPEEPNSATTIPYKYLDCRLYDDGVEIFGAGSKLVLFGADDKYFEVAVYGSIFDLFSAAKDKSIRELDLGTTAWNLQTVADSNADDNIMFPIIDWDENDPSYTFPDSEDGKLHIRAQYILPAVKFKWLCEQICEQNGGYKLELPEEVTKDPKYLNAVVPHVTALVTDKEKANAQNASCSGGQQTVYGASQNRYYRFTYTYGHMGVSPSHSGFVSFTAPIAGEYTFFYQFNIESSNSGLFLHWGSPFWGYSNSSLNAIGDISGTFSQYLRAGDELDIWIEQDERLTSTFNSASITCSKYAQIGDLPFPNEAVDVASKLPDITQLDVLKTLAQLWCLIVEVNERSKVVRFFSFNEVYDKVRKHEFRDWSEKVAKQPAKTEFRWSSYGKRNIISYAEGEGKDGAKLTSEGYFSVEDDTLSSSKNLFTIAFSACEEVENKGLTMAKIRAIPNGELAEMQEAKAKLLYVEQVKMEVHFEEMNPNTYIPKSSIPLTTFSPVAMVNFMSNYHVLENRLLHQTRCMKETLLLTALDVKDFDHSAPIYLSKYSCCFYVNKINNFRSNRLVEVELVALHPL